MDHVKRSDIPVNVMPGIQEQVVFGKGAYIHEEEATMKYVRFASELGEMSVLQGASLAIYIQDCKNVRLRYGVQDKSETIDDLRPDDVLCISADAWAKFEFDGDGYADCMIFSPSEPDAENTKAVSHITREAAPVLMKNGRKTYRLLGAGSALVKTGNMSGAFATFASRYGCMESHCHENEYMYVVDARNAVVSFGPDKNSMDHKQTLHKGDILRPHLGEWHRFDFTSEDGFVDFCNLFAVAVTHVTTENDV